MATPTYVPLGTVTIGGGSGYTVSGIPDTYKHLTIVIRNYPGSGSDNAWFYFNSQSPTVTYTGITGNTSIVASTYDTSTRVLTSLATAQWNQGCVINVFNYANTSFYKTFTYQNGDTTYGNNLVVGNWYDTSKISSFTFATQGYANLGSGTISVYGVI
jgi:hypothetical protein